MVQKAAPVVQATPEARNRHFPSLPAVRRGGAGKEGLGDKILLDGIPATPFMPHFPVQKLENTVNRLIDLFSPNLILGVSDELPPNGEIGRFDAVSRLVKRHIK